MTDQHKVIGTLVRTIPGYPPKTIFALVVTGVSDSGLELVQKNITKQLEVAREEKEQRLFQILPELRDNTRQEKIIYSISFIKETDILEYTVAELINFNDNL